MRICYVTSRLPHGNGETFLIGEINRMRALGHEVLVVPMAPRDRLRHEEARALLPLSDVQGFLSARIVAGALRELLLRPRTAFHALGKLRGGRSARVALKNDAVALKGLWLGGRLREWGAEHLHAHWAYAPSSMAMLAAEVAGIPWSMTAHRGDIAENNLLATKLSSARFTRFIALDGLQTAEEITGREWGDRAFVLHMGVHLPETTAQAHAWPDTPVILCPAHLIARKGHHYLLEAMRLLRERGRIVRLAAAGEGAERSALQAQAEASGIGGQVELLGLVSHEDLMARYERGGADMVVLPTLHEGIPVALMEAMAYGIPVISTTTGGIPELLDRGAGMLVSPADAAALADAIERLCADEALRASLRELGRKRVTAEYAASSVVLSLSERIVTATLEARMEEDQACTLPREKPILLPGTKVGRAGRGSGGA